MLKKLVGEKKTIFEIMQIMDCSKNTIRNYIKQLGITTFKGFYSTGKTIGRPKGFKHTEEWKLQHRDRMLGDNNPFYGKAHNQETRDVMSENHADFNGDKNPFRQSLLSDDKKRAAHKLRCQQQWDGRDEAYREVFRKNVSRGLAGSKNTCNRYKYHMHGFFESDKCGRVFYRSSWEKRLCELLVSDEGVFRFTLEEFYVSYKTKEGIERFTRIDFMVYYREQSPRMIEVKPKSLWDYGNNKEKIVGLKNYCQMNKIDFLLMGINEINEYATRLVGHLED